MISIQPVTTKKQRKQFVEFPLQLYKGNPYFVPPLYMDEMAIFKPTYVYADQCKSAFFLAYDDQGKVVGRIQGILQYACNTKRNQKTVRFTRFDAINDQQVANALFGAVEQWALDLGMDTVIGPLGYSDLEREGLLIEGFDHLSTFEEQYNYPYYQTLIENLGYVKDIDWVESQIFAPKQVDPRLERISSKMLQRYNLHIAKCKNIKQFIKKYADGMFAVLDTAYDHLYGTVPFTPPMRKMALNNFKLLLDARYISAIVDENDKVVTFGLVLPSIAKAVQKSGGRLTLPTIVRILKAKRKPEVVDFALVGVLPQYAGKGIVTAMICQAIDLLKESGVKYAETNLNLEDNYHIQNQWKNFEAHQHKRRRSFIKKLR
ncbi:MAG: hypothetical protein IKC47_02740 [Clostridia bacterium]|nr:hypothetical protein [Clostridia bacterium]